MNALSSGSKTQGDGDTFAGRSGSELRKGADSAVDCIPQLRNQTGADAECGSDVNPLAVGNRHEIYLGVAE